MAKIKNRGFFTKLILVLLSLGLALLLAEILSQCFEKTYLIDTKVYLQKAKPFLHQISRTMGLGYELIPKARSEDGFFTVNSAGLRDREYALKKPEDVFRIIVLGDSVTFGTEYPVEETYPKLLEKILNRNNPTNRKIEVINAGVCGYNAVQKVTFFKTKLREFDPDLVVFQFLNDDYYRSAVLCDFPVPAAEEFSLAVSMGEFFRLNFPRFLPLPENTDRYLLSRSAFYRLLNKSLYDAASLISPGKFIPRAYCFAGISGMKESMAINQAGLKELYQIARDDRFLLAFFLVPDLTNDFCLDPWIVSEFSRKENAFLLDMFSYCRGRGIDLEEFRITPEGKCHFNQAGHKAAAEFLAEFLKPRISDSGTCESEFFVDITSENTI